MMPAHHVHFVDRCVWRVSCCHPARWESGASGSGPSDLHSRGAALEKLELAIAAVLYLVASLTICAGAADIENNPGLVPAVDVGVDAGEPGFDVTHQQILLTFAHQVVKPEDLAWGKEGVR